MLAAATGGASTLASAAALLLLASAPAANANDCPILVKQFNKAIDDAREADAQRLVDQIATNVNCGGFQVPAQRSLAALRLGAAQILIARSRPSSDFERLLRDAETLEVLWQASATLGEVRFGERRFADAALAYDRAIEIVKNESLTPAAPSKSEIETLMERSAQARLLAASGVSNDGPKFVNAALDHRDGTLGGVYSRSVRGIVPRALPVPVTFEFGTTTPTAVGIEAIRELVTVLKEQRPQRVTLIGHTDIRGSADFNQKLSQDRAQAVAEYLKRHGVQTDVQTLGKGSQEPIKLSDTSGLTQDDIYALNRRVEWRRE